MSKSNKGTTNTDKSRNGSKPRGNFRKGKSSKPNFSKENWNEQHKDASYEKTPGSNDYTWHVGNDRTLLDRASQISWSYQAGGNVQFGKAIGSDFVTADPDNVNATQPGILIIRDQLACGPVGYEGEGGWRYLNTLPTYNAANSLLTAMRSRARVRNTYDAPDLFMLMYAAANVYAGIAFAKRILATVNMFSYQNEYMPRDLIRAQGINADDVLYNQYKYVTQLNVIISEMNKIYIPNRMHLFQLYNERFSNYFTEGSSIKDQLYVFTPAFLNIIDFDAAGDYTSRVRPLVCLPGITTIDTNGLVSGTKFSATNSTGFDVILTALKQMVTAIIEHDSTPDITGDMENCFGTSERFVLSPCMPDAIAMPIFDEEILETIHNMTGSAYVNSIYRGYEWAPGTTAPDDFTTIQRAADNRIGTWDYITVQDDPGRRARLHTEASFRLLDVHRDPSPEKTFAITRLRNYPCFIATGSNSTLRVMMHFATDLICSIEMYYLKYENGQRNWYRDYIQNTVVSNSIPDSTFSLQSFHYRPMQQLCNTDWTIKSGVWPAGESDIYAEIPDHATILEMDRISLLSLLGAYNNV